VVGENLRQSLDWLPKGRELLTIKKDCELDDHIAGLPPWRTSSWAPSRPKALKAFYEKYGFKGLVKQIEIERTPPELIGGPEGRHKPAPRAAQAAVRIRPACSTKPPDRHAAGPAHQQPELRHGADLGGV
jgi:DNA polymerase-1